ncbi:hypothetical protein F5J12DRAFT_782303 [Pisolithus orientalis]|uniref:uncharacterized protein n=1 Tax=Pisolithus orientalis TaxID=936130 RepID=UPI00222442BE|nr:uncharacterized protein F5J12DRAFT_782303 [Pisolithus orientalis]KAI6008892.1 hypothetical protein F5J12DRAFT_782303 [Pisolithus orientalis]
MPTKEGLCQGSDGTCNCEVFFPKKGNTTHCLECLHGISKHHNADGTSVATQPLPAISSSSNVVRIFEGLANKHPTSLSQVAQLDPCHEALAMKSSKLVQKILTLQIEIKANDRKIFIQQLEDHGCYLQQTIKIDTSWSHDNITTHLHSWFPKVFRHFNAHSVHPNSIVLACFKGCQKASIADSNLWFVELDIVGMDIEAMSNDGSEVIELLSSVAELNINAMAETVNANALPTWPCQPAGPISGLVMVKELLSDSDDNTPPNPWSTQFNQTMLLKDDDVSDIDL